MAKSFQNIKKSLGLLDFLQFGKYKGCRVDSIVDMDDEYLRFMQTQGIKFDASVIDALTNKFSAESIEVEYDPRYEQEVTEDTYDRFMGHKRFDDVPF
jgi:uncharacterized protein (DUF3820 family)